MRILVVGGGGREHALCWAISASPLCTWLYCAPGNAGIAQVAECVDVGAEDIPGQVAEKVGLGEKTPTTESPSADSPTGTNATSPVP